MADTSKPPLVSYQPFRLLFQLAAWASIIVRLPVWIVIGLVPSLRPNRHWSFRQTVMARIFRKPNSPPPMLFNAFHGPK